SKSHKSCRGPRICIDCAIVCDFYNNAYFIWKGIKRFFCFGCKKIFAVKNETTGAWNEGAYVVARAQGRAEGAVVFTAEKKWCRRCWRTVRCWGVAKRDLVRKAQADKVRRRAARIARRAAA
ncbi:hypothetical protein P7C71_g6458, partial [Lecanoromycetidae sp. Uapishka_2]